MKYGFTFVFTLFTSGFIYFLSYLILAQSNYNELFAIVSFFVGLVLYLLIRLIYKSNQEYDLLLAKAYRLILWLIPLLLISVIGAIYVFQANSEPASSGFYSFSDLAWSGPFVFAIWPILNFFALFKSLVSLVYLALFLFGLPLILAINVTAFIFLVSTYKKLIKLQQESVIHFSLFNATLVVILPYFIYLTFVLFISYI